MSAILIGLLLTTKIKFGSKFFVFFMDFLLILRKSKERQVVSIEEFGDIFGLVREWP